jgi:hypothetical protein
MDADTPPTTARTLASSAARERRRAMLTLEHVKPLTGYVQQLRTQYPDVQFPDFDPMDGGINARVLFLFEKPGPMTAEAGRGSRVGSGFISRDNDDPSADATFHFMQAAGLLRAETVLWNAIPGWNGTRKVTGQELREGLEELKRLLTVLHQLQCIVLVGLNAQRAMPWLADGQYRVIASPHPSPLVKAKYPARWRDIPQIWKNAR